MLLAGRIRPALALGFAAGVYLLALTGSTRFGLGLGMDQLTGAAGVGRWGADYGADLPTVLGGIPGGAAAPDLLAEPWRATRWMPLTGPALTGGGTGSTPTPSPATTADTAGAAIPAAVVTAASTKKAAALGHEGGGDSGGKDRRGEKDGD